VNIFNVIVVSSEFLNGDGDGSFFIRTPADGIKVEYVVVMGRVGSIFCGSGRVGSAIYGLG